MSSNTKKPETPPAKDTKDTKKTKDTTKDTTKDATKDATKNTSKPAEESGFMKFYHKYFKTDYLVWIFFGILLIYYFLNNYRFVNGKYYNTHGSKLIGTMGAFLLFFFYVFFFLIIISAYRDMMEHYAKDPIDKKSGGLALTIIGTIVTIAVMYLTLYYLPYSFANAGIIAKGLLRVWNPFSTRASRDFPNATDIRLAQSRENPIEGYDTDGLYWGDKTWWGRFKFYVLSLPLIVSNFFAGSFPLNYYLIPAISGDSSKTGSDWTRPITGLNPDGSKKYGEAENVFAKSGGLGWILWFISFIITLPYRAINTIVFYINKWFTGGEERNLFYEYFNPIDWEVMGTLLMPEPNNNNTIRRESISRLFNTIHFETKYSFTRTYAIWFNVYFLIMAYQLVENFLLFPYINGSSSKNPMDTIKTTIALVLVVVSAFYILWQVIQQSQKEIKYLNILNFRSLGPQKISLDALKHSVSATAVRTMPGLFGLVDNSVNGNANEPSSEPNAGEPDAGEPDAGEPNAEEPNAELPSVGNLDKAMENKTRASMGVTSATVAHNSALKNKENAEPTAHVENRELRAAKKEHANATALKNKVEVKARDTQQKLAQHQQLLNAKMQQGTNTLANHRKSAALQAEAVQHPRILQAVRQKHAAATNKLTKAQQKAHQAKRTREGRIYPNLSSPYPS